MARRRTPVAFVGRIATSAIGRARFDGYRKALKAPARRSIRRLVWDISQGYRADAGYQAMSEALAKGLRFRAVVAASDELALGCMAAAADRGFAIPDDMAFVGFGGLAWVRLHASRDDHRGARCRARSPAPSAISSRPAKAAPDLPSAG